MTAGAGILEQAQDSDFCEVFFFFLHLCGNLNSHFLTFYFLTIFRDEPMRKFRPGSDPRSGAKSIFSPACNFNNYQNYIPLDKGW